MVTTIRLPEELHRGLKEGAKNKGVSLNAFVLEILWKAYRKEEV